MILDSHANEVYEILKNVLGQVTAAQTVPALRRASCADRTAPHTAPAPDKNDCASRSMRKNRSDSALARLPLASIACGGRAGRLAYRPNGAGCLPRRSLYVDRQVGRRHLHVILSAEYNHAFSTLVGGFSRAVGNG